MSTTPEQDAGLTVAELGRLVDGVQHSIDGGGCWKTDCAGSLPWAVERIVAEHVEQATRERQDEVQRLRHLLTIEWGY